MAAAPAPLNWRIPVGGITETPRLDRGSLTFKTDRIVQFFVGDHGPFQIQIPSEEFTSERVKELLDAQTEQIRKLFPS